VRGAFGGTGRAALERAPTANPRPEAIRFGATARCVAALRTNA
jgi:hypothetical protein